MEENDLPKETFETPRISFSSITITQASIAIIILSLLKQIIYYAYFHVPIKYFLGISELGIIISGDLFAIGTTIIIVFPITYQLIKAINKQFSKFPGVPLVIPDEKKMQKDEFITNVVFSIFFFGFLIFSALTNKFEFKLVGILMLIITIFSYYLFFQYDDVRPLFKKVNYLFFMTFLLTIIVVVITAGFDIKKTRKGKYIGTKIETTDSTYISTATNYFIGKTEKSVFIYNSKDTTTTILPSEAIKSILFKEDVPY